MGHASRNTKNKYTPNFERGFAASALKNYIKALHIQKFNLGKKHFLCINLMTFFKNKAVDSLLLQLCRHFNMHAL